MYPLSTFTKQNITATSIIERMRNFLSKILVYYYPLADRLSLIKSGRMKVDCVDNINEF